MKTLAIFSNLRTTTAMMTKWILLLFLCFLTTGFGADLLQGVGAADAEKIKAGKTVYIPQEVGKPWPRAVVYRFVPASPREVMAVFTNYAQASQFVPNVVLSRVTKEIAPWEQEVFYELSVPLLPNENYTATNLLAFRDHGKQLEVSWKARDARYFKSSVGNVRVMDYRGGTLMRYTNLVDPGSKFARILRSTAEKQIVHTVNAIAERVLYMKSRHPAELQKDVERLNEILKELPGGKS
jgi:carbon monoxide dehydrogenase subunit G